MTEKKELSGKDFISIFWRSFFIQAVWNYRSMLSIGFIFALTPVAKKLSNLNDQIADFYLRHIGFFNSQPYLASFALGSVARAELEEEKDKSRIERLKNALIGPLGALGDQLFWGTIKPASILLGICSVLFLNDTVLQILGISAFILIYNIPHFYFRWSGIHSGYREGFNVYKLLNLNNFKFMYHIFLYVGAFLLGLVLSYTSVYLDQGDFVRPGIFSFALGCAFFISKWQKSFYITVLSTILLTLIVGGILINI